MVTVTAVSATGGLGSGFSEESLRRAVAAGADFIGCDAGSTDAGPYFLGSGEPKVSAEAYQRDLRPMLRAAAEAGIPLLMGTSGYAGARAHVHWAAERVREVAAEEGLAFTLAIVDSELEREAVHRYLKEQRVTPLPPSGPRAAARGGPPARARGARGGGVGGCGGGGGAGAARAPPPPRPSPRGPASP
jgi:hypothetical protein